MALLCKWRPAYPVAILVLLLFVVYEVIRMVHTGSLVLPLLAALDLAIAVLVIREYRAPRRKRRREGFAGWERVIDQRRSRSLPEPRPELVCRRLPDPSHALGTT